MKKLMIIASLLLIFGLLTAQTPFTATYTFGADGNVASFTYNGTTYAGFTMGTIDKVGVTSSSSSGNFRATTWPTAASLDTGKYIGFTMTAVAGYKFTVNTITFGLGRSATGTRTSQWRGSANTYAALINNYSLATGLTNTAGEIGNPDNTTGYTGNVLTLDSNYANITTSSGFRYYMYAAEASGGTAGLQGPLTISGTYQTTGSSASIGVNPSTLSGFTYVFGTGPSDSQSFELTGSNLGTNSITVSSASTDYVICATQNGTYGTSLTYPPTAGSVSETVYVKLKSGLAIGTYNSQNIACSATGATTQNLTCSGTVTSPPATTTIPYAQTFSGSFGDTYTYTVSGTKPWYILAGDNATANGYQSTLEEQWLVLPGINFNNYTGERMTFNTIATFGAIDANNYLKLFFSSNYPGLGNPSGYTWTEISFANGGIGGGETPSGVLDLSGISGINVYLAFKYCSTTSPTRWEVDDVNIYLATPIITVNPATLTGFTYVYQSGPSAEQSFNISGADLQGDISIDAPSNFEISTGTGAGFAATDPITLTQRRGSIAETTIYVRLKGSLAIGQYNNEVITATSTNATSKTVTCSGSVTSPPPPNAPVATDESNVATTSFTANWGSVSGVSGYRLDVYTKTTGGSASELFISEYLEGSSYNKYIEIYNGTGSSVDLSAYSLKQYNGGATTPTSTLALSSTLASGSTYVVGNSSGTIYTPTFSTNSTVMGFNGNDAVALFNGTNLVDVVGPIGDASDWGKDVTLVRKAAATVPKTTYSASDWDSYASDTTTYLGSHTFSGGVTTTYVTGYQDKDVSNIITYGVTGLTAGTTYYYVVRAYDGFSQTSANSNEIEVTTTAAATEVVVNADGTATGATIVEGGSVPASLLGSDSGVPAVIYTITSTGIHNVTIYKPAQFTSEWYCWLDAPGGLIAATNPLLSATAYYVFTDVNFDVKGDIVVIVNDNQTLPVELSSFTATMTAQNTVSIMWVTQSETNVNGYYIHRGVNSELSAATIVSPLIAATNTSQQQYYQFTDSEVFEPGTYYYWLQAQDLDGSVAYHGPTTVYYDNGNPGTPVIPKVTELKSVYPNPFNPNTTISYSLATPATVDFIIYNGRGQIVRNFNEGSKGIGTHQLQWNGSDNSGRECSTGVYYIKMLTGKDSFIRKAVLLK